MREWQINLLAALSSLAYLVLMLAASWGVAAWIDATDRSPAWLLGVFLGLPLLWMPVFIWGDSWTGSVSKEVRGCGA